VRISTELPNPLHKHNKLHLARRDVMTRDDDLRIRLGRVRDRGRGGTRPCQTVHCPGLGGSGEGRPLASTVLDVAPGGLPLAEAKRQALQQSG
jgi:hypothetical protein